MIDRWTQKRMREVAYEEREALGLGPRDAFDPWALCREHGISVYTVTELRGSGLCAEAASHFLDARRSKWSAALVPLGSARIIIENDADPVPRRRSSISHELGHHLLEHDFDSVILGEDHSRQFDSSVEKQATYFAGELLVPLAAAERMAFDGWDNAQVAEKYNVSEQFAQMQMKGQRVRAAHAAAKFGL